MNFEFLRKDWPELADFGGYAEEYAYSDPQSALIKLRSYGEFMVNFIYQKLNLPCLPKASFHDKLKGEDFASLTPSVAMTSFFTIKNLGNRAAHDAKGTDKDAVFAIKEAHHLGAWLYCGYHNVKADVIPEYKAVDINANSAVRLKQKLDNTAALYQQAMAELAQQQKQFEELSIASHQSTAKMNVQVANNFAAFSTAAAKTIDFDEARTRKYLIDLELREVDWNVGDNGKSTEQVGQEVPVTDQPTPTGKNLG